MIPEAGAGGRNELSGGDLLLRIEDEPVVDVGRVGDGVVAKSINVSGIRHKKCGHQAGAEGAGLAQALLESVEGARAGCVDVDSQMSRPEYAQPFDLIDGERMSVRIDLESDPRKWLSR